MRIGEIAMTTLAAILEGRLEGAAEDFTTPRVNVQAFRHAGQSWVSLHAESLLCGVTRVYSVDCDVGSAIDDFDAAWRSEMQAMLARALAAGARP